MKAFFFALVFGLAAVCAGPLAAADSEDGLNDDLRRSSFYNEKLGFVATLDLTQLSSEQLANAIYGLFEPESLAFLKKGSKNFETEVVQRIAAYGALATGLLALNSVNGLGLKDTRVTVMGADNAGLNVYLALPLGFTVNEDTFIAAKASIQNVFSSNKFDVEFSLRDDFVLVHSSGAGIVPADYQPGIEDAIRTGLAQARGAPAVNLVAPTTPYVRTFLASAWKSEFGKLLGEADYVGGYGLAGPRPEVILYARFSGDTKAKAVKELYDKAWDQQIAEGKESDRKHVEALENGKLPETWYINWEQMLSRIRAATQMTVFGGVVQMNLDTTSLRQITGALVDGYYRKAGE